MHAWATSKPSAWLHVILAAQLRSGVSAYKLCTLPSMHTCSSLPPMVGSSILHSMGVAVAAGCGDMFMPISVGCRPSVGGWPADMAGTLVVPQAVLNN